MDSARTVEGEYVDTGRSRYVGTRDRVGDTMKFKILVQNQKGMEWWESYDKDVPDPQEWARETVAWYNEVLRPGELPRTLLKVEIIETSNDKFHKWAKSITGMSVPFRGQTVDIMYCEKCGITGKRYGLAENIKIDSKYRGKKFVDCSKVRIE